MTVVDYLPGVERHAADDAGPMMADANWKFLLHTMETDSFEGGMSTLDAKRAWPQLAFDLDVDGPARIVQAVSFNRAARALRSGGARGITNAAKVVQVEIKGFAHETPFWTPEKNKKLGEAIARVAKSVPFRLAFDLPFYGDTSGFTVASPTAKQRLAYPAWYSYDAICGHEHAPNPNAHWDPGQINTAEIALGFGISIPTPIVVPKYEPPKFNQKVGTLRPGPHPLDPERAKANRTLKVMMKLYGLGDHLDLSTPEKAETWGSGTSYVMEEIAKLYFANKHEKFPSNWSPSCGPELWNYLCALLVLKHAMDQAKK